MDYLVQRANRHDADRVIVGEVLGDEIVPMLNAMTAGKAGSMCTIHADSTEGTFGKIKTYASQSPKHLSDNAAAQLTAQALDLVIFVRKRPDSLWSGPALRVFGARGGGLRRPPRHLDRDLRRARGRRTGGAPPLHATGTARPVVGLRLRGPPPPGVRTMTPVVVLFGAGIGVGLALVVVGHLVHRPAGRATVGHQTASTPPTARPPPAPWFSPPSSGWSPTGRSAPPSAGRSAGHCAPHSNPPPRAVWSIGSRPWPPGSRRCATAWPPIGACSPPSSRPSAAPRRPSRHMWPA